MKLSSAIFFLGASSAAAFAPASNHAATKSSLYMGPPVDPSAPATDLYGEGSRKFRRTVYTHNEWVDKCLELYEYPSPTKNTIMDIEMDSPSEGWAVGEKGTLLHFRNGTWHIMTSPIISNFSSVSIADSLVNGRLWQ